MGKVVRMGINGIHMAVKITQWSVLIHPSWLLRIALDILASTERDTANGSDTRALSYTSLKLSATFYLLSFAKPEMETVILRVRLPDPDHLIHHHHHRITVDIARTLQYHCCSLWYSDSPFLHGSRKWTLFMDSFWGTISGETAYLPSSGSWKYFMDFWLCSSVRSHTPWCDIVHIFFSMYTVGLTLPHSTVEISNIRMDRNETPNLCLAYTSCRISQSAYQTPADDATYWPVSSLQELLCRRKLNSSKSFVLARRRYDPRKS